MLDEIFYDKKDEFPEPQSNYSHLDNYDDGIKLYKFILACSKGQEPQIDEGTIDKGINFYRQLFQKMYENNQQNPRLLEEALRICSRQCEDIKKVASRYGLLM